MKQLKVEIPFPPVPPPPAGPRYRYFANPPATLSLRVGDLVPLLPDGAWTLGVDSARVLELPADEILKGPVPKISLNRLAELAPDCFRRAQGKDVQIRLPVARLASTYRLVTGRELIEEAVAFVPPVETDPFAPPAESTDLPPIAPASEPTPFEDAGVFAGEPPAWNYDVPTVPSIPEPELPAPAVVASAEPPAVEFPVIEPPVAESTFEPPFVEPEIPAIEPAAELPRPAAAPLPPPPPPAPLPRVVAKPIPAASSPSRNIFSVLPMFRRKPPAENAPINLEAPKRPRVILPGQKSFMPPPPLTAEPPSVAPLVPESESVAPIEPAAPASFEPPPPVEPVWTVPTPETFAPPMAEPAPEPPPMAEPPGAEPIAAEIPLPPEVPALWVETEHLPKTSAAPAGDPPQHEELQALFLTEEVLTVDRVVELCGGLPGIESCVLSHGAAVIASHKVPDTIDLVSLSAHALEMLRAMRSSSAKMGIGTIPAVTLHSEKGPITFFQEEDLCLLVLHKDRGFVPGVREKLSLVVKELAKSNLPKHLPTPPPKILEG